MALRTPGLASLGLALFSLSTAVVAQTSGGALWTDVAEASADALGAPATELSAYRTVRLDRSQMAARLAASPQDALVGARGGAALTLPLPDGGVAEVRVREAPVMAPELQAQFPEIRTYLAEGEGSVTGRLSLTPAGFRGMLFTPEGTVYVDPYGVGETDVYVVYFARDVAVDPADRGRSADTVVDAAPPSPGRGPGASRANGATLRTYRLAVAATGEYTAFHGGTVAGALAGIAATVNRVTGIYERDLAVRLVLVASNNLIVYTDGTTDPYSNTDGVAMLSQNQANLTAVIGGANYDIGHVFSTGGGGVAGLGVVCSASFKAQGVTGSGFPRGDGFDIDYVAHEMGHQFGGNHTFNGDASNCGGGNRNASTAVEPGSGSTIQAYAGICGAQNIQGFSDAYFHAASLDEMTSFAHVFSGSTCGTATATGNPIPTVTVPAAVTIPVGTPFALTGAATDDAPGALTYTWEEMDLGAAGAPGSATPPLFRSFLPTASPTRTFPQLARLVGGLAPVIGETLPTTGQTLRFRLTARDNRSGGGAINDATVAVTTDAAAGPFAVTFASTAGQSFAGTATVTWSVAGTNTGAVNTPTVDIVLSTDNGATFGTVLAAATPNDGTELVSFPVSTVNGRVMVRAVGNVFFNVNPQRFTATAAQQSIAGAAGWRLLAAPAQGFTVDDLAAINLVQGVPGYYAGAGPNLFTGYTGSGYTTTGTGAVLPPGRGFWWRLYNQNLTPGGPSNSFALPTTLTTSRPAVTADVPVAIVTAGDGFNLLGNPFGTSLDVSSVGSWTGASSLRSTVLQVWKANGSTYENSVIRPTVSPWQGFWAEGAAVGTLTIPASARTTGGVLSRPAAADVLVAFELASALAFEGGALVDHSAALVLGAGRDAGHDRGDAVKLAPISAAHVLLAFGEGASLRSVESRPLEAAVLPLAVASVGAGEGLVLTWPRVEGLPDGWALLLRDLATGRTVDLAREASYAFTVVPTARRTDAAPTGARASGLPARFALVVGPRGVTAGEAGAEGAFALDAPRPNPARGATTVGYGLAEAGAVRLSVFDLLGREVAVLASGDAAVGRHVASIDGSRMAPGVYVVRLSSGRAALTQRLVVVR